MPKFSSFHSLCFLLIVTGCGTGKRPQIPDVAAPTPERSGAPVLGRRVLFGNPDVSAVRLSPDGRWLTLITSEAGVKNLALAPIEQPSARKFLTHDRGHGVQNYFWAWDSSEIYFLQDRDGDENHALRAVDLEGNVRDLFNKPKVKALVFNYSRRHPHQMMVGTNERDPRFFDAFRLNLATGVMELVQKNEGYSEFFFDDENVLRFGFKYGKDAGRVLVQRTADGWRDFIDFPTEDALSSGPLDFDATGKFLYITDSRGKNTSALSLLNTATRQLTVLSENPSADAGDVIFHPKFKHAQAVNFEFARSHWVFLDRSFEEDFKRVSRASPGDFSLVSRDLNDKAWLVAFRQSDAPLKYYLYNHATRQTHYLFSNRKDLESLPLRPMRTELIPSRDGYKLLSYLTLPATATPAGPRPLVLLVHGGPWARDTYGLSSYHQLLANRGYAVLSVNFRGSTGLGKKFLNAGNLEWGGKMQTDLMDAVDWAVAAGIADPARIAIMGGSYGGYATLAGLAFYPERFACGVDLVGPSNLKTLLATIPPYWESKRKQFVSRIGDPETEEGQALLHARSPLNFAHHIRRPLLIAQGANDPRVLQAESDQIVTALAQRKIPVTYLLYPDEGHGFTRPENNLSFMAVTEAFLARCLGGTAEPIGFDLKGSSMKVMRGAEEIPGLMRALRGK